MKAVKADVSLPQIEEEIIEFWERENVFLRSMAPQAPTTLEQGDIPATRPSYVFYDGPPFATGLPHYGHLLAGTIKYVVCRFSSMKRLHVYRRSGWECHGVPVEFQIQKSP